MLLEIKNLAVAYGDALAIRGVSLDISEGEIVGIVGPNGAGKSTLINSIAGLKRSNAGEIWFGGKEISSFNSHQFVDEGIALVPEGRRLFGKMTVLENLELGAYGQRGRRQLSSSLERVLSMFPILKERRNQSAGLLSGGQQQMVAIGRALLAKPKLLLMDEPSLGLAPIIVSEMFETITAINKQGISVLLVEQNATKALAISKRAYVLENGSIVISGPACDLMERREVRTAYLGVA